jgi:hypothetical protein
MCTHCIAAYDAEFALNFIDLYTIIKTSHNYEVLALQIIPRRLIRCVGMILTSKNPFRDQVEDMYHNIVRKIFSKKHQVQVASPVEESVSAGDEKALTDGSSTPGVSKAQLEAIRARRRGCVITGREAASEICLYLAVLTLLPQYREVVYPMEDHSEVGRLEFILTSGLGIFIFDYITSVITMSVIQVNGKHTKGIKTNYHIVFDRVRIAMMSLVWIYLMAFVKCADS